MKRRKISGYAILLTLLAVAYILVEWYRPAPVDWTRTYINSDKMPYGTYALFELLEEVFPGAPVENVRIPAYNLFSDTTITGNYVFLAPQFKMDENDREALLKFVRAGNQAFIAAELFEDAFLDSLGINALTNMLANDSLVHFVNPHLGGDGYSNPPFYPATWFTRAELPDTGVARENPAAPASISEDLAGRANFIRLKYGEGYFYLHSRPALFSNYYILRDKGHEYAFKALSYLPVQTIWWDEYYKQGRIGSRSVLGVIGRHPTLRWAWYLLIGGVLLYMLFEGKRRQRIIPPLEPLKNTSLEFARVVSSLYYHQRDFKDIALKRAAFFMEEIRSRYQELAGDPRPGPGFINRVAARSGVESGPLEKLFQNLARIKAADRISEQELLHFNGQLEEFYKKRV